jgi:hypothetical protein
MTLPSESVPASDEKIYAPLAPNIEAAIGTLIVFERDEWPEHYRQGALRQLRRTIREEPASPDPVSSGSPQELKEMLTPEEAKALVVLARHEARMQRDTPEWDTWLNLADKLTRFSRARITTASER